MKTSLAVSFGEKIVLYQVDKLGAVMALSFLFPFLFHVIPVDLAMPLGMIWLPIFYAPLLASRTFRPHVALIAAGAAPALNSILMNMPRWGMVRGLTLELLIFSGVCLFLRKKVNRWWMAGMAFVCAKIATILILRIVPPMLQNLSLWKAFLFQVRMALPGLFILTALDQIFVRCFSK